MSRRVYVEVTVQFTPEGQMLPLTIRWEDGTVYQIDRVLEIRRAAALKAGGCGLRYRCRIGRAESYLFWDDTRWFVESKDGE